LSVAIIASGFGVLGYVTHLLRRSELQTIDARFTIRGRQHAPRNVVLVQIDDATFAELTRLKLPSEFPFPRRYEASVIDNLRRAGARAIALDIEFAHPTDERDDEALFEALQRARGKTVLAATEIGRGGKTEVLGGAENQREAGVHVAEAILTPDTDGSIRRFQYSFSGARSFPVAVAEVTTGRPVPHSTFEHGSLPIDFLGPQGTFTSISFAKVLEGQFPHGFFAGKTVIIGASAPVLQDVHNSATSGSRPMSGSEILANASVTLLHGVPLRTAPGWLNILLVLILGAAVPLAGLQAGRWRTLLDAVALAVVFTIAVQVAFNSGLIVSFVYPMLALALGTLGTLGVLYVRETLERERIRAVFSRFVPDDVVEEVLARTDENLRLGGVERDCTVMFSDLRGFTSFSQTKPANVVIEVVNHYLNEMSEAILAAGGTLIAYMGDGIMAVFGAPLEAEDHADRAVAAAREMVGERLDRFNEWIASQGFDARFAMGVGVHSGPVMAGNVGSEERVEYTAVGDTTNTAARLESMTKDSGTMLFISGATKERLRRDTEGLSRFGEVEVRGREGTLEIWTIWPPGAEPSAAETAGVSEAPAGSSARSPERAEGRGRG
jgi:adenylate cyclase